MRIHSKLYWLWPLILTPLPGFASDVDENREAIKYLKNLGIEDLANVEVALDDVFDVFDGLVKAKKVTIATGDQQSTARAPSVTTVITAQDIEAMGATDLDDVLEMVPGLHVNRYPLAYLPLYIIRGIYSSQNPEVLMLVNGIRISNSQEGSRSIVWGGMPVNNISRIEIIRGPGSAVYGADAFSGIINIITKTTDEIKGTETGMRLGSFGTREGWVLHGQQYGGFEVALALEYRTTDGPQNIVEADTQTQFDKLFGTSASFAPGPVNLQRDSLDTRLDISQGVWQLRAGYQGRRHVGGGAGAAQALSPASQGADDRLNADLTYHNPNFTDYWDVTTQLSYLRTAWKTDLIIFPPGAFGGSYPEGYIGNPGASEAHSRLEVSGFYAGLKNHLIRLGAGYQHDDMYETKESKNFGINPTTGTPLPPGSPIIDVTDTPYVFSPEVARRSWYLFLQDVWRLAAHWELTVGVRYDDYSDFGSTVNPRTALVWQPQPDFTGKLLYGRAFRAPAFNELNITSNPVALGNPNLKPETIDTWELAFDYRATETSHVALNLFKYQMQDKILYLPNPDGQTNSAQNAGTREGQGFEMEARWKLTKRSSLMANYSYVKTTAEDDHDAGNYPQHSGYLRTDWLFYPNWYLDTQLNWIAGRNRVFGDPRPTVDDYTTIDLTVRRKDIKGSPWNFAISVRNLFDTEAREPSQGPDSNGMISLPNDLPLAGRNYFLELRYRF